MIGYYVHHQGLGHLHRALAVAEHARTPLAVLSSLPPPAGWAGPWIRLPRDDTGDTRRDPTANGVLHWAPLHHPGLRERMATVARWTAVHRPALLMADVSAEVALLARLMGVPVVVAAMRGNRLDRTHRLAYDLAHTLLAPWPGDLPEPDWPSHWRAKTVHTGAFSRFDGRPPQQPGAGGRTVLVMLGAGGHRVSDRDLLAARAATPDWSWQVLGADGAWSEDPWPQLSSADVVVTHAGQNAVAECAAARRPAVVIPQHRPFGEQHATAAALRAAGLALVRDTWPRADEWPQLLSSAQRMTGPGWQRWAPGDGARRAAALLDLLAEDLRPPAAARPLTVTAREVAQP